jgi:GNAT superfamily N-acetyltransferase
LNARSDFPSDSRNKSKAHEEIVSAWVHGWTMSRHTSPPIAQDNAYRVDVGLPGHVMRYVVPHPSPTTLHELSQTLPVPGTWIKVCAEPGVVAPHLPRMWQIKDAGYMMTAPLRRTELPVPQGYRLTIVADGAANVASLFAANDELAARGRIACTASFGVIDQVETSPLHRRLGLGSFVMNALCDHAAKEGARTGLLVATEEGRSLYLSLGWTQHTEITSAVIEE